VNLLDRLRNVRTAIAEAIGDPNHVHCRECGRTQEVDAAISLKNGWPKCCGYTMTIDCDCSAASEGSE